MRRAFLLLLWAACLSASPPVWANGRFPKADQLVAVPGHPEQLVLRTTFGLLFSRDAGSSWDWLCEQAVGFAGQEDPAVAALGNGTVLAALSGGLAQSSDGGCSWRFVQLSTAPLQLVDSSVRPLDPTSAVVLAWEQTADANAFGLASRFFATVDSGATWADYGTGVDPRVLVLTLDVASSDPHRLYASGIRPTERTAALFVSTDDGQNWSERPVPFDSPREQGLYIAGIDPLDAERVYVRTSGASSSRLFVTQDAGVSFEQLFSGGSLLGFALAPDGSEIYVGGLDNGLWAARRAEGIFEQRSALPIACLMRQANLLYACSNELTGFALGVSADGGRQFTSVLHLADVRGPLACSAATSAGQCPAEWPGIAERLGIPPEQLAPPSATEPASGSAGAEARSSGCSVGARQSKVWPMKLLGLVGLAFAWRAGCGRRKRGLPARLVVANLLASARLWRKRRALLCHFD